MFKDITWLQFLSTLVILLVVYYAYLAIAYYPQEIKAFLNSKRSRVPAVAGTENELMLLEESADPEDDEPDTVPDDESEPVAPKVALPTASLASLAAVTRTKPEVGSSTEEEAEETYDDELPQYSEAEVGEGRGAETGVNSAAENLPFTEETIVSTDNTNEVEYTQNEEKSVIYSEYDDMIPKNTNFGVDGSATQAFPSPDQDDLPTLQEDEPDYSISVTSLATHLSRVNSGEITSAAELVAEVPNLVDTELLKSMFASALNESSKTLRSRLAGIEI